jgi:DNA-binding transcriptional regulator GbsR (MarR family)
MKPTTTHSVAAPDWRQRFIEELGGLVLDSDTPRAVVRVLGWIVVCDPPQQTAGDIQEALTLSSGSVSAAVRTLVDSGMLERVARPGERHTYYRLRPGGWGRVLESRFRTVTQLREVADRALVASRGEADHRLMDMRDAYSQFEAQLGVLIQDAKVCPPHLQKQEGMSWHSTKSS